MPSKATKRLNKKEINNIIKEAEKKVEENIDIITRISPFYDYTEKREQKLAAFNRLSKDDNIQSIFSNADDIDFDKCHNLIVISIKKLMQQDIEIQMGLEKGIMERRKAQNDVRANIVILNPKNRYFTLKKFYDLKHISQLSKAFVMMEAYYENNETESDWTYKIGELCFGSNIFDYATIKDKIEFEMKVLENQKGDNIKQHMCFSEAKELKRLIEIGEPFSVYRGVLIKPDEMIRGEGKRINKEEVEEGYKGRKDDGEEFYRKWNAGKGVSLSLSKETAYFFCDWNLKNKCGIDIDNYQPNSERFRELQKVPNKLWTEEEWIENNKIISSSLINDTGLKPVIVELEVNPKDFVGSNLEKGEGELNVLPENCKVKHYEFASGESIARNCFKIGVRRVQQAEDLIIPLEKDGISMIVINNKPIFADTSKIYEKLQEVKERLIKEDATAVDVLPDIIEMYIENEIKLPKNISFKVGSPVKKTYFEWLKNPIKKLIEVRRKKPRSGGRGF